MELGFLISPFFSGLHSKTVPQFGLLEEQGPFLSWGCSAEPTPSLPHSAVLSSSPARQNHNQANFLSASFLLSLVFRSPSAVSYNASSFNSILGIFFCLDNLFFFSSEALLSWRTKGLSLSCVQVTTRPPVAFPPSWGLVWPDLVDYG